MPSGNIDSVEVLGHLRNSSRLHASIRVASIFRLYPTTQILSNQFKKLVKLQKNKHTANRFSRIPHSFLAWLLLGYSIGRWPLLETICSGVKDLLVCLHRGWLHHALTSSTSLRKSSSSMSGFTAEFTMLLAAIFAVGEGRIVLGGVKRVNDRTN